MDLRLGTPPKFYIGIIKPVKEKDKKIEVKSFIPKQFKRSQHLKKLLKICNNPQKCKKGR